MKSISNLEFTGDKIRYGDTVEMKRGEWRCGGCAGRNVPSHHLQDRHFVTCDSDPTADIPLITARIEDLNFDETDAEGHNLDTMVK